MRNKIKISSLLLKIIVSLMFSFSVFMNARLHFVPDIYATVDDIFFFPVGKKSVLMAVFAFIFFFVLISLLELLQKKVHITYKSQAASPDKKDYIFLIITFLLLICAWSPYFLSFFPGGIYPDTAQCFGQAVRNSYNNQQPVLYSLLIRLCILVCGQSKAMALFTILQVVFMAGCFSYIIFRLRLHKVNLPVIIAVFSYFALFNLIPLYVVSLWKDTVFSAALLVYIFLFIERIILSTCKRSDLIPVVLWMVVSVFLRNNGIYVMILSTIICALAFRKTIFTTRKFFFLSITLALIICYAIQGPLFKAMRLNGPFVENLGVLQQQLSYTQIYNGDLSVDESAFLCQILPFNDIGNRDYYRPFNVDSTKWSPLYNNEFLEENKVEFLKVWFSALLKNPRMFADSYLFSTMGYWNPFRQLDVSYTNSVVWEENSDDERFVQTDFLKNVFGGSIREWLLPNRLISSAVFLFITLILFCLSINKKDKSWLAFIPALTTYLTVFIATPLAFALRYVYIVVLTLPIYVLIVFLRSDK